VQHIDCTEYPVVGWLIGRTLQLESRIHRTTLVTTKQGRINIYFHQDTFILECDTNGDHNANDYYFFRDIERSQMAAIITSMGKMIGSSDQTDLDKIAQHAMDYVKAK
jgi:hypothetical protein